MQELATGGPILDRIATSSQMVAAADRAWSWGATGVLAVTAVGLPLFSWAAFGDQVVMPRLAGTYLLTGLLLLVLAGGVLLRRVDARVTKLPLLCTLIFLVIVAIATTSGVDPHGSLLGEYQRYQGLLTIAVYVALMLGCLCAVATAGSLEPLAAVISAGGTLAAGYAVLQRLGLDWVGWSGIPEGRVGGAFAQPDVLGTYLVMTLAVSAGLLVSWRGFRRSAVVAGAGVMLAALIFTGSRGAWLGAVVSSTIVGLALLRRRDVRSPAALVALVLVLCGGAALLVPSSRATFAGFVERVGSSTDRNDTAVSARLGLWRTSLQMIRDRPILGAGPDAFSNLFASYRAPDQPGIGMANVRPESSHNFFLDQLVGMGILGLAAYMALGGSVVLVVVRHARRVGRRRAALPIAMVGALAGYHAAVLFSFSEAMTGWLPWMMFGGLVGACARLDACPSRSRSVHLRLPALALGVAMIIAAGLFLWSDHLDGQARRLASQRRPHDAAAKASLAARINPLVARYLIDAAAGYEAAADATTAELRLAQHYYEMLDGRFYHTSYGALGEARVRARIDPHDPEIGRLVALARSLDPYNRAVGEEANVIEAMAAPEARQLERGTP